MVRITHAIAAFFMPLWLCLTPGVEVLREPASTAPASLVFQSAPAPARIDQALLVADVRALSSPELEGRLTGSAGNRRAQAIILERFTQLKLQPVAGSHLQKFSFAGRRREQRPFPEAANLIGMVPGRSSPDRYLLITAHYDHLGIRDGRIYPGADDNASGVAAMLAIAGWFAANPPSLSLVFVAFDAEEQGLQGARYFVANPPIELKRIAAVINLDMLARGDKNVLYVAGTSPNPALKAPVTAAAAGRGITVEFGHDRPGVPGMDDWTQSSDHGPFHAAGVPFLYFGVEDHADYHQPTDTADKFPIAFYRAATEVVLDTVIRLADARPSPQIVPFAA